MNSLYFIVVVFCLGLQSLSAAGSRVSRSILRDLGEGSGSPDFAVELNISNFDQVLKESPEQFAIVEFFAHWCPACRNYKHHYEKVAKLFNGRNASHPGLLFVTRVDCALTINQNLCNRFSVDHYPTLLWGPPSKFANGEWKLKQGKSEIQSIDDGRTAEKLLTWINERIGSSFGLEDEKYENEYTLPWNTSDRGQISRAIYDVEEASFTAYDIILSHKMIKSKTRGPLIRFLQLLVAHHPSRRCRRGSAEILANFDDMWPSTLMPKGAQEDLVSRKNTVSDSLHICGKEVPRGYWIFCRGSKNETRGFSCGLWILLHSLSVRLEDEESHLAFTTICDFIHNFFICDECSNHFYSMCSSVTAPLNTTRDFVLWLWETHNRVNMRLAKEEASSGSGDPKFPKTIWPPKQLCPSCYTSLDEIKVVTDQSDWDKTEVFNFLLDYYGKTLVSSHNERIITDSENKNATSDDISSSTNAIVVPVGAALGIAIASCAFGALAWCWRLHQKNRKYLHHLHSLKNI